MNKTTLESIIDEMGVVITDDDLLMPIEEADEVIIYE